MKRQLLLLVLVAAPLFAQNRVASDFEIEQMEKQAASSHEFLAQLSAHLNLGDLRATRSETSLARREYTTAYDLAARERLAARAASDLTRYATATSYAALAQAKLGDEAKTFALLEESMRYASDSAKSWNLYASAMTSLHLPRKAASAARNAVAIEEGQPGLDLEIYRYSLASALLESGGTSEAERLLVDVVASLRSNAFASLRGNVARKESFEIYSTARGEEAAFISLRNRAQLRLAALYEARGDREQAVQRYRDVLADRTDDPAALAALARLSAAGDRERYFAEAFDANPFSQELIRDYRRWLAHAAPQAEAPVAEASAGAQMRLALTQLARGQNRAARETLEALRVRFPDNEVVRQLIAETEQAPAGNELQQLLAKWNRLTPEERVALDARTFVREVLFDPPAAPAPAGQTVFESGTVDGVPFRFAEPTAFAGTFATHTRLTFRLLGATVANGADALLLEPVKIEAIP